MYIHNTNQEFFRLSNVGLELIGVEIHVPDPIIIFFLYTPQHAVVRNLCRKIGEVSNDYTDSPLCIVGDFNEDILAN